MTWRAALVDHKPVPGYRQGLEVVVIKVLVDGRAVHGAVHGIARYTIALVRELTAQARDLSLQVICHPDAQPLFASMGVATICSRVGFVSLRSPLLLSHLERQLKPDVVFCPSFVVPLAAQRPLVMTLHDATHLVFPQDYSLAVQAFYRLLTLPAARRAKRVLTVSDFSRQSLAQAAGLSNVKVIFNGVDTEIFFPEGRREPRLGAGWVLYAGGYKPHKRVELLLAAMAQCPDLKLALVGDPPASVLQQVQRLGLGSRLLILGPLDDESLAAAYRAAEIFVYPSRHEGFGLPPLEAMACGTPVICANLSSLPEVVGEAGILFHGGAEDLAAALQTLHKDPGKAQDFRRRGLAQAQIFLWSKAGAQLAQVLREAAH